MSAPIPGDLQVTSGVQPPSVQEVQKALPISQRTLLQVEDNEANAEVVKQLIGRRSDLQLLTAVNGYQGIEMACTHLPDVILMDIKMAGIDGHQALKILRENPATAHIPVIALSSNANKEEIGLCLESGFFRYVTKPYRIDALMAFIDEALHHAATNRQESLAEV